MSMTCNNFCSSLYRKKTIVTSSLHETKLKRCLGLVDLLGLGLGSTLGLGVYVITSYAITYETGPSYVISVIIAGVASLFAGLCYAEFTARLPRSGSAYLYTYVTLGEMCGFVVGWNMLLEQLLSAVIAAKAWSQYVDFMLNGTIKSTLVDRVDWHGGSIIGDYPDVLASALLILITVVVMCGSKVSSLVSLVLVFFNMLILICFVCVGFFHVKHENWTNPPGFFAHGFSGILGGAATLFFAYSNFEVITSSSEETREPSKTVPSAIMYSVLVCSAVYFCVAIATTLSLREFHMDSAVMLPKVLQTLHVHGASSIITIGGMLALTASALCACFYLPRLLYAMSNDRLLFSWLSSVGNRTKVPVYSTLVTGALTSVIALVVNFDMLLQIVSVGTLIGYTSVSVCVLCSRYRSGCVGIYNEYEDPDDLNFVQCTDFTFAEFHLDADKSKSEPLSNMQQNEKSRLYHERSQQHNGYTNKVATSSRIGINTEDASRRSDAPCSCKQLPTSENTYRKVDSFVSTTPNGSVSGIFRIPSDSIQEPNDATWRTAAIGLITFIVCSIILSVMTLHVEFMLHLEGWWTLLIVFIFSVILISSTALIAKQPQNGTRLYFKTPYVPFVPLSSILINTFLMASLSQDCWIRFAIWMAIGLIVFFGYSRNHSVEKIYDEQEVILYEITDDTNMVAE